MIFKSLRLLCLGIILSVPTLATFSAPAHQGYVTDLTGQLSQTAHRKLESLSSQIDRQSGSQVATLIIPTLGDDETIESYANKVYEAWGIGQKGQDNGALFLVAIAEKKVRIEVGYGLEGILPDGKTGQILDQYVLPYFKEGSLELGIIRGHTAIAYTVAKANNIQLSTTTPSQRDSQSQTPSRPLTTSEKIIGGLIVIAIIIGMIISPTFREIMFWVILSFLSRGNRRHSSSGHFGGGGFGGFGGGMSGGGGASRGW